MDAQNDAPLPHAAFNDIGGAIVRRPFLYFGRRVKPGEHLSEAEVRRMPIDNRKALVATGQMQIYPKSSAGAVPTPAEATETFTIHRGSGKYDVIKGVKLNAEPLSKDEAEALISPAPHREAA